MVSGGKARGRNRRAVWAAFFLATTGISGTIGTTPALAQASETRSFDIPAQPLPSALTIFGRQSGLQISVPAATANGRTSTAIEGEMTPVEALSRLLTGTGLTYRISGNIVTLERAPQASGDGAIQLGPVRVEGSGESGTGYMSPHQAEIGNLPPEYAGGQVARGGKLGVLGNVDIMDAPFNQTAYTSELIQNQQARTIADVIANDPSVRSYWPTTAYGDPLVIRGFLVTNQDVTFGGLSGVAPSFKVALGMVERVEVLKGPSAMLSGAQPNGAVGGAVNIVPKRAKDTPITQLGLSYVNANQFGVNADIGRRYGTDKALGIRITGSYSDGDTMIDDQSRKFAHIAGGMDYRGEDTRLTLDLGYQHQNVIAPTLVTRLSGDLPALEAPDASSNWFFPWSWADVDEVFGAVRGEYDMHDDWTVYAAVGGKVTDWGRLVYFPTVTNASGDLIGTPSHQQARFFDSTGEIGLRGNFEIGAVHNQLSLSATHNRRRSKDARESFTTISSNLYNPASVSAPRISDLDPKLTNHRIFSSLAIADVMSLFDEQLQLIGGVRLQYISSRNYNLTTGDLTVRYKKRALTPSIGVVVKPTSNLSLYANYIEALQQGTVVGDTFANAGETLPPYVSEQYEAGIKIDWGRLTTTLSAFQITQASGTADIATNTFTADGKQRNRGLEFNTFGEVADGVRVLGGLSYVETTLVDTANGMNDGNEAAGVPRVQVNMGIEWDTPFARNLTLSSRLIYTGEQELTSENTTKLPEWTRFDLGARYTINHIEQPIVVRFNIQNVLDKSYWSSSASGNGYTAVGAPRTFLLSVTTDF